jgi:Nucleotidyl transferase AbiEii toxin, Type IV TA system
MTPEIEPDYLWIRKQIICAIASDRQLGLILALKGGNALAIIHEIGERTSLDLDYSITTPSAEEDHLNAFLQQAITARFADHSLHVIDWKFSRRPSKPSPNRPASWGGFMAEFKLVRAEDCRPINPIQKPFGVGHLESLRAEGLAANSNWI